MTEEQTEREMEVVWSPLPGSQTLALSCPCNHILYEGTRGPGKTDAQVMFFRKFVGAGYGQYWRGIILDREYKNLDDIVAKSKKWFFKFGDGAEFKSAKSDYKWVWPTGEELLFRQMKVRADYDNYHGHEYPFIGWNELTKQPTSELYDLMMSCNRTSFDPHEHSQNLTPADKRWLRELRANDMPLPPELAAKVSPELPLIVFSTTNPYGPGHNWVDRRFVRVAPPGKVVRNVTNVFNPRTQQREDVTKTQVRIFGSYKENRYLTPEYVAELEGIRETNRRRAWLYGDWDIVAGGALDDLWRREVHVLPRFRVPSNWRVNRSFDWGSSHPFSVGWWAEANGEGVELPDGRYFCPPKGTLVRCHEWYGTTEIGANKGLMLSGKDVGEGIALRETKLVEGQWVAQRPRPGPADTQIWNEERNDKGKLDSIAKRMARVGISWTRANKSKGTRKGGLQLVRDRLEASLMGEGPGLYVMQHCEAFLETVPVLPRDDKEPDDVDTEAEDHVFDETRYRVLDSAPVGAQMQVTMPT